MIRCCSVLISNQIRGRWGGSECKGCDDDDDTKPEQNPPKLLKGLANVEKPAQAAPTTSDFKRNKVAKVPPAPREFDAATREKWKESTKFRNYCTEELGKVGRTLLARFKEGVRAKGKRAATAEIGPVEGQKKQRMEELVEDKDTDTSVIGASPGSSAKA